MCGALDRPRRLEGLKMWLEVASKVPVPLSVRLHGDIERSYEGDYEIAGTRGESLSLESFRIDRAPVPNITIRYRAYIRDVGIVPDVHVGEWIGSPGKDLIAFSASLEGPDAHKVNFLCPPTHTSTKHSFFLVHTSVFCTFRVFWRYGGLYWRTYVWSYGST